MQKRIFKNLTVLKGLSTRTFFNVISIYNSIQAKMLLNIFHKGYCIGEILVHINSIHSRMHHKAKTNIRLKLFLIINNLIRNCDWLWENLPLTHKDIYLEIRNSIIQSVIS